MNPKLIYQMADKYQKEVLVQLKIFDSEGRFLIENEGENINLLRSADKQYNKSVIEMIENIMDQYSSWNFFKNRRLKKIYKRELERKINEYREFLYINLF